MSSASIEFEVDKHLHSASTKALIKEMTCRKEARDIISEIEDEVISFADDDKLVDELEIRDFKVSNSKYDDDDWFEIKFMDWRKLAEFIATGSTHEALELIEYMSNGEINAICAMNYTKMLNQLRAA